MAYDKPNLDYIWAEGGDVVEPNATKKQLGWVAEVPPHQYENYVQRRQDEFIFHSNQRGIPEWDGQSNYLAGGKSYVMGSNGKVYKSVLESGTSTVVKNPVTDLLGEYWKEAFAEKGNVQMSEVQGLHDALDDKVDTSTTISAGTGLSGGGDLSRNRTLAVKYGTTAGTAAQGNDSRITGAVQAAGTGLTKTGTTLGVNFGTTAGTVMQGNDNRIAGALQKSQNLGDLGNAGTARSNLGLGTAATANVTTSPTDRTAGRLIRVGDLGWEGSLPLPENNANNATAPGVYYWRTDSSNTTTDYGTLITTAWDGIGLEKADQLSLKNGRVWARGKNNSDSDWVPWREMISTHNLHQTTGQSTEYPMSQKAVTDAINASSVSVSQATGQSTTAVMSQKAVSDQLLGVGQTWQDVTGSRTLGTTYTNTTGKSIYVMIQLNDWSSNGVLVIDGISASRTDSAGAADTISMVIPNGGTYRLGGTVQMVKWLELR